ncbi:SIS domain-containing protein [Vibrio sp. SS-MA-C1-2]|uniref:MurR/RpiR family transcriptional regulator n=1 Tax=Vibrio sp. SS-MA-C1-2 TaxID=2908646 RepID=UPI001F36F5D9|nr:SIS domain-containing protein [Vibrio sp. SS-MA-C1-2]UJF18205.1 SIS domain-containing protein [Vibrio sp. SS-MA-C1-2]
MSVLVKISNLQSELSTNGKKIAQMILQQPEFVMGASSMELAERAEVSQSAIIKFSQKVGFKGFTSLKIAISKSVGENHVRQQSTHSPIHNQISSDDALSTIADKLANEKILAIEATTRSVNDEVLHQAIALIDQAKRVQIIGLGASALVAQDFSYKLLKIGVTPLIDRDSHVQLATTKILTSEDIQVVLSFSGKHQEINNIASIAKQQGVTVIALTSVKQSKLRTIADITFDCIADEAEWRSSSISSREAQQTLIDLLFFGLIKRRGKSAEESIIHISNAVKELD